jgi:MscS family membrane protein
VSALLLLGLVAAGAEEPTVKKLLEGGETEAPAQAADAEEPTAPSEEPPAPPVEAPLGPVDDFDRGVPRTSGEGFLEAADAADWERAAEYLDLRDPPPGVDAQYGPELARQLKLVLERALWIDLATVSTKPEGHPEDGLPASRDFLGRIETPDEKVDILLQRVRRDDGVRIWKFSNRTVAQIPTLYASHGFGPLGEALSGMLPELRLLGSPLWEWVGVAALLAASFAIAWIGMRLVVAMLGVLGSARVQALERALRWPFVSLVALLIARASIGLLGPTVQLRAVVEAHSVLILVVGWLGMRTTDQLIRLGAERLRERGQAAAAMLGNPLRNFVRGVIALVAGLAWLDGLGYEITTVLAGLGIGGVAIALAAQRSIEDLIGAFTILASQPVRIGDFCRFGEKMGTVEEVSLRATRIRTLDDTVVSVPNGEFAKLHLDNFGRRRKILYRPRIRLRYETTPDQIRQILRQASELFAEHPKVLADPARIRFVGFGEWSLDLDVFAYLDTTDYGESLEIAEDLNLRIMAIVEQAGSGLAVPIPGVDSPEGSSGA